MKPDKIFRDSRIFLKTDFSWVLNLVNQHVSPISRVLNFAIFKFWYFFKKGLEQGIETNVSFH